MEAATSYAEWREAAVAHDKVSGVMEWVNSDESKHFDYVSIRQRLRRLRRLRKSGFTEKQLSAELLPETELAAVPFAELFSSQRGNIRTALRTLYDQFALH